MAPGRAETCSPANRLLTRVVSSACANIVGRLVRRISVACSSTTRARDAVTSAFVSHGATRSSSTNGLGGRSSYLAHRLPRAPSSSTSGSIGSRTSARHRRAGGGVAWPTGFAPVPLPVVVCCHGCPSALSPQLWCRFAGSSHRAARAARGSTLRSSSAPGRAESAPPSMGVAEWLDTLVSRAPHSRAGAHFAADENT